MHYGALYLAAVSCITVPKRHGLRQFPIAATIGKLNIMNPVVSNHANAEQKENQTDTTTSKTYFALAYHSLTVTVANYLYSWPPPKLAHRDIRFLSLPICLIMLMV